MRTLSSSKQSPKKYLNKEGMQRNENGLTHRSPVQPLFVPTPPESLCIICFIINLNLIFKLSAALSLSLLVFRTQFITSQVYFTKPFHSNLTHKPFALTCTGSHRTAHLDGEFEITAKRLGYSHQLVCKLFCFDKKKKKKQQRSSMLSKTTKASRCSWLE